MVFTIGLEGLPIEAIECITNYLPPTDLNNCCAVSPSWHDILGQDVFWKRHCNLNVIKYIKSIKSKLDNSGNLLRIDPCLLNVGEWRLAYVYENQLRRNWKFGHYATQKITIPNIKDVISADFYDNDFILLSKNMLTEVWTSSETLLLVSTILYNFPDMKKPDFFRVVNDMLVVIQYNLVKVFKYDAVNNYWPQSFSFLFDKGEELSSVENDDTCINSLISSDLIHMDTSFSIFGNILIGLVRTKPMMHLWDIVKKKKVKEQDIPPIDGDVISKSLVEAQPPSDIMLVECCLKTVEDNVRITSTLSYFYSMTKLEFLPFNIKHCGLSIVSYDFIYILERKCLFVYNYKTGNNIFTMGLPMADHHVLSVFDNKAAISCNNEIQLWNPLSNEGCMILPVCYSIDNFKHIWDKFVLTEHRSRGTSLWHIGETPKLIVSLSDVYLSVNNSCTKLLLRSTVSNDITILNFW